MEQCRRKSSTGSATEALSMGSLQATLSRVWGGEKWKIIRVDPPSNDTWGVRGSGEIFFQLGSF